jgi:hypothetical protein
VLGAALIPTVVIPAFRAASADPTQERITKGAGFSKTGMWKEVDKD